MSFAFGHITGAWLFGKINEFFSRKKIKHLTWGLLLLGGILPDIDFLLDWLTGSEVHRTLTHSFLFMVGASLIVYLGCLFFGRKDAKINSLALGSGIFIHLILDMFFSQGVPLLWPNLLHFSFSGIHHFDPLTPSFLNSPPEKLRQMLKLTVVDMGIGTTWISYLWLRKRIRF